MITKLNSRISLHKRAKKCLTRGHLEHCYTGNALLRTMIIYGKCPDYFDRYICFVNNRHHDTTWASTNMDLPLLFSTPRPANVHFLQVALDYRTIKTMNTTRVLIPLCKFRNLIYRKYKDRNSKIDNFIISRNF